jgi:hypothetical protein
VGTGAARPQHLSDGSGLDQAANRAVVGIQRRRFLGHQCETTPGRLLDQSRGIGKADGHGFLGVDMFACLQRLQVDGKMALHVGQVDQQVELCPGQHLV